MKHTLIIIGLIFTLFGQTSCESDFLDKQPSSQLSSESFWKTEQDVELALTGVYSTLQQPLISIRPKDASGRPLNKIAWDAVTDDAYQTFNYGFRQIIDGTFTASSEGNRGAIHILFETSYKGIQSCNFFLNNIDKLENIEAKKIDS